MHLAPPGAQRLDHWSGALDQGKFASGRAPSPELYRGRLPHPPLRDSCAARRPSCSCGCRPAARPTCLEARGPSGWTHCACLGLEPEVRFAGGPEALREAARWLGAVPRRAGARRGSDRRLRVRARRLLRRGRVAARGDAAAPPVELAGFRAVYAYEPAAAGAAPSSAAARARSPRSPSAWRRCPSSRRASPAPPLQRFAGPGESSYLHAVELAKKYIRAGDVYQVNLARRLAAPAPGAAELRALYARLADATARALLRLPGDRRAHRSCRARPSASCAASAARSRPARSRARARAARRRRGRRAPRASCSPPRRTAPST